MHSLEQLRALTLRLRKTRLVDPLEMSQEISARWLEATRRESSGLPNGFIVAFRDPTVSPTATGELTSPRAQPLVRQDLFIAVLVVFTFLSFYDRSFTEGLADVARELCLVLLALDISAVYLAQRRDNLDLTPHEVDHLVFGKGRRQRQNTSLHIARCSRGPSADRRSACPTRTGSR
jgi:hypothetical protein